MQREDLDLYLAIHHVYPTVQNPRSDRWIRGDLGALSRMVQDKMPPDAQFMERVAAAWSAYGKSGIVDNVDKRIKLVCEVAVAHGRECFWKNRGKGECSDDLTLGRLDHTRDHTADNCVIECSRHNSTRQDKSIEQFLASDK